VLDLGIDAAPYLIADDDEAFTYNKRGNRVATMQEHYMIVRALERGVSEKTLPERSTSISGRSKPNSRCLTGSVPRSLRH